MQNIMNALLKGSFKQHIEPMNLNKYTTQESQLLGFIRLLDSKNFRYIMESKGIETE